jgi:hypothetical protein
LKCNQGFSINEAYLASLIECARLGSTADEDIEREKIRRVLRTYPKIKRMIESGRSIEGGRLHWEVDRARTRDVLLKLAHGHALFDLADQVYQDPQLFCAPICEMSEETRGQFEKPLPIENIRAVPEVGSRELLRWFDRGEYGWQIVQPERYRYYAHPGVVRIVFSEYLAVEIVWP